MSVEENTELFELSLEQLIDVEVTSASLTQESLSEAPVPVTVITAKMIEISGARNIKDLLTTYTPNFTHVEDQNESNIAARGVFTSSQQKILLLIDGHRINSRSYSMAAPDYAISLDKIKQIEVLRGPSSSLYGNVALTATVNIILKDASEMANSQLTATIGNQGHKQLNVLFGKTYSDFDMIAWAQLFEAEGDIKTIEAINNYSPAPAPNSAARLSAYQDKYTFDIGAKLTMNSWQLMANTRRSHYIEPFTTGGISGEGYQYKNVPKYKGTGPGFGYLASHINLRKNDSIFDWQWHNEIYADKNEVDSVVVTSAIQPISARVAWQEYSYGMMTHISRSSGNTDWLFGLQFDHMTVTNSSFKVSANSQNYEIIEQAPKLLKEDSEQIASAFAQVKYQLSERWLANIGARFDAKNRSASENINNLSPRLAVIYQGNNGFNLKASYATSFVDATYWNRFSTLGSFRGASNLKPEELKSFQLTPSIKLPEHQFYGALNIYYNQLDDFIFRDNWAGIDEPNYSNSGELVTWGVELESRYTRNTVTWHATVGFQAVLDSERFATTGNRIDNVPSLTASLITSWQLADDATASLTMRYIGEQTSPIHIISNGQEIIDPYPTEGVNFYNPNNRVKDVLLLDSALNYQLSQQVKLSLSAHNLLNTNYQQGGTTLHPYPQAGRNIRASLRFIF